MSEKELMIIGEANGCMEINLRILDGFNISVKSINLKTTERFGTSISIKDKYNNTFFSYSRLLFEQVKEISAYIKEQEKKYIIVGIAVNSKKQAYFTDPYKNETYKEKEEEFMREIQLIEEYMKLEQEKDVLERHIWKVLSILKHPGDSSDYLKSALIERKKIIFKVLEEIK